MKIIFRTILNYLKNPGWYYKDLMELKKQKGADTTFEFDWKFAILSEKFDEGEIMKDHYFHQDLNIARL